MGLFDWLAPRELKAPSMASVSLPLAPQWDNGQAIGAYGAFAAEGYNGNTVVNAAIREIATSASLPKYRLMAENGDEDEVIVTNSDAARVLYDPNEQQCQADFVELLTVYLMVTGNGYAMRERNASGRIVALRLLRPDRVEIKIGRDGRVAYYEYTIEGVRYDLLADDVAHIKLPNPHDDVYGLSPLQVASKYVNLDTATVTFLRAYFANAGVPAGILKVNRRLNSQAEADSARAKWRSSFSGNKGWHGIAVLDEDATYQQVAPNIKDMDTSTMTRVTETRICAVFGVPPILLGLEAGLEASTYSNYEQARSAFWDETISPLVRRIEKFLQRALEVSEREPGNEVEADFSDVPAYEDDHDAESARIVAQYGAGIITLNEARAELGREPLEHGDMRRLPVNITEIMPDGTAMLQAAPAAAPMLSAPTSALKASVQVPSYISANAERGLAWNADGLAGDGLTDGTVREARQLAAGSVSDDKVRRMSAWFARHLVDLDRPQNSNPDNEDYPGPGAVAWALWGGSPTNPQQAMDWADAKVAALDDAEDADSYGPMSPRNRPRLPARRRPASYGAGKEQGQALPRSAALGDRLLVERETLTDDMELGLKRYFDALRSRVAGVLGRAMQQTTTDAKIEPDEVTVEMLFPAGARNELARVMGSSYARIIRTTWDTIAQSGVAGVLEFSDRLPIVSQIVALATSSAEGIDQVSRTAVSRAIQIGIERGYSIQQVARGVPAEGFPGINSLVEETYQNRARTIARTETMRAQNAASIGYYREQGIRWMRAYDPDGDPDDNYIGSDGRTCSERSGLVYTSDDSIDVMSHPNCRLTWTPISLTQAQEMGLTDGEVTSDEMAARVEVLT